MADWKFDLSGGQLALDFSNTVSDRTETPIERLTSYEDLVRFARQTGIVDDAGAGKLLAEARGRPDAAVRAHAQAIALRDALYDLFAALSNDEPPPDAALAFLNTQIGRLYLDGSLTWRWSAASDGLDAPLGPIVRAAIDLLTGDRRERIRMCAADTCAWVFLDMSKNRSRRWCAMSACGNREKSRRHYARHKHEA